MKTYSFSIDGHAVSVEAIQSLGQDKQPINAVDFTATCEGEVKAGRLALHPKANKTQEQLEKDMEAFARRLATETAGNRQSKTVLASIFKP